MKLIWIKALETSPHRYILNFKYHDQLSLAKKNCTSRFKKVGVDGYWENTVGVADIEKNINFDRRI